MAGNRVPKNYDPRQYAVLGARYPGSDAVQLVSDEQMRVIVFDNKQVAVDVCQAVWCQNRLPSWNEAEDVCTFMDFTLDTETPTQIVVIHPYPIYDIPAQSPVRSETKVRKWRRHVIYTDYLHDKAVEQHERERLAQEAARAQVLAAISKPA